MRRLLVLVYGDNCNLLFVLFQYRDFASLPIKENEFITEESTSLTWRQIRGN